MTSVQKQAPAYTMVHEVEKRGSTGTFTQCGRGGSTATSGMTGKPVHADTRRAGLPLVLVVKAQRGKVHVKP